MSPSPRGTTSRSRCRSTPAATDRLRLSKPDRRHQAESDLLKDKWRLHSGRPAPSQSPAWSIKPGSCALNNDR